MVARLTASAAERAAAGDLPVKLQRPAHACLRRRRAMCIPRPGRGRRRAQLARAVRVGAAIVSSPGPRSQQIIQLLYISSDWYVRGIYYHLCVCVQGCTNLEKTCDLECTAGLDL